MIATHEELVVHRRRIALGVLVLVWGVQAIVTQSLLLREALVLMSGSEFAWGVVLFAWLFGVAVGALVGGRLARRGRADLRLVTVLLMLSGAACVEIWIFRDARAWLGVAPGELLPLARMGFAAMVFVSPVGALVGMAFPLACCVLDGGVPWISTDAQTPSGPESVARDAGPLGNIYALESAGSLIGGAAFSFWAVEHFAPIQSALVCGALTAAASAGLLWATARRAYGAVGLVTIAAAVLLVCVLAGDAVDRGLVLRRWKNIAPGYELRAETESKYQNLAVGFYGGQFTLYCDGHLSTDFPNKREVALVAHPWMCQHPSPRHVLVLGGGVEGWLAEILKHPVEHIDYVEPDARQIELIKPCLTEADPESLAALQDERVTVHHLDARYFIKTRRNRFDLVIARLPEPTSALRARLYTDEFYAELRRAMTGTSVFCMSAAAMPADLSAASAEYLASIRATVRRHFPHVLVSWDDPAYLFAATNTGVISTDPVELTARYQHRGVVSELFDPVWFQGATDRLDPDKLRARSEQLDAAAVEISTDLRPAVYMQRLVLWEQMTGGRSGRVVQWLRSVRSPSLVGLIVAMAALTLLGHRLRRRRRKEPDATDRNPWAPGAVVLSIATTGFVTMALSIVWLFAFQNLYGYVYSRIGWIIALFMAGLVLGCWVVGRRSRRGAEVGDLASYLWRRLMIVDVFLALLAAALPFILPALGAVQNTRLAFVVVEASVSVMVMLTGVLGGAAFALAGGLQLSMSGSAAGAAGVVNGADHAGACLGALLTGIVLVPVFGTATAAFLLGGIKLGSAVLLMVFGRPRLTEPRS